MKKSDKLVLIGNFLPDHVYSMENYLQAISTELDKQGVSYDTIRPWAPKILQKVPHKLVQLFRYFSVYVLFPLRLLFSSKSNKHFHIIDHSYSHLASVLGSRCSLTCHDLYPYHSTEKRSLWGNIDKQLFFWATKAMKRATKIVAVSHYTKQDCIDTLKLPDEQIVVSHEAPMETIQHTEILPEDIDKKALKIIHVGTNHSRKNIEMVLSVMKELKEQSIPVQLIKVGAPFTSSQESLITSSAIGKLILHKGFLSDEELSQYYSAADILLFPSTFEGFGFPVLEAMKCNCAVVALNATSLIELIEPIGVGVDKNEVSAFVSAILELRNDKAALEKIKRDGAKYAKSFSWKNHVSKILVGNNEDKEN